MQHRIVKLAWMATATLVLAIPAFSAQDTPAAAEKAAVAQTSAKPKPSSHARLVDINSASKTELKQLTGIGDAEADRIIAGRPYLSKADLATRGIVSAGVYESIKKQVMAKPKSH